MDKLKLLREDLKEFSNPKKAKFLKRFFKTGKGQYGYGDIFLGLTVSESRGIAQKYAGLSVDEIEELIKSKIHEERLIALVILVNKFQKSDESTKKEIFEFYLNQTKYINNWDLVDLSADKIVGSYLLEKPRNILVSLSNSKNLWEKRIAIIATYQFIKEKGEYEWTFKIAGILLKDPHDLIQKAVGWMLREVGKRSSREVLEQFLKKNYQKMPRTMLRYAIEHFPIEIRQKYLKGEI